MERLAPSCGQLVLMRSPGRNGPVLERFRPRIEELFAYVDELAARHGALVVDLYGSGVLGDQRMWAVDRLHLTAEGHRRVAEAVLQTLGLTAEGDWQAPLPPAVRPGWAARRFSDLRFARRHLGPWIGRRLTGRSSGDGITPLPVPHWDKPLCPTHCGEVNCHWTWDALWPDVPPVAIPHTHRAVCDSERCALCAAS